MAKMLMPLQIQRQYASSLDADYSFNTLEELKNYATTSALSYSGQILYCVETDTLYKINSDKTDATEIGGASVETPIETISVNGVIVEPDENKNINIELPEFEILTDEDVFEALGMSEEELENLATIISDEEVRTDKTYSSSKIYEELEKLKNQGGLGGDAVDVGYENADYPDYTNVGVTLDAILSKIYYVAPKINSFTMTPSTTEYEIGTVVNELTFAWTVNKEITSQTLTDCTITVDDRTATYSTPISATKNFVLTISDDENSATASKKISFLPKIYYGSAVEPAEYDSAFALGLSNSVLSSSVKRDYSFNCGSGEYSYIICPTSCSFDGNIWVNGFQADMQGQGSISLTNASGYTQSYDVWRFANHSLGSFVGTVK